MTAVQGPTFAPSERGADEITFCDWVHRRSAPNLAELVSSRTCAPNLRFIVASSFFTLVPNGRDTAFQGLSARFDALENSPPNSALATLATGRTPNEAARQLRIALELALTRGLGSSRRVAVLTGGGLDSGGLLTLVDQWARRHDATYFALAMDFEGRGDDRPYLRALEERLRCNVVRVAPEEGARYDFVLGKGIDCAPTPWPTAAIELAAFDRAKREGADAVVAGSGGDILFNGEPRALAQQAREDGLGAAIHRSSRLRGFWRPRFPAWSWIARPLLMQSLPVSLRSHIARTSPVIVPRWAGPSTKAHFAEERRHRRRQLRAHLRGEAPRISNLDLVLSRVRQQFALACGIRRVEPFLDPDFQAFCRRIPPHWLLAGDIRRGLFREALRDLLPAALYAREDKAFFEVAFLRLVRAGWGFDHLRQLARVPMLAALGVIEPAPFREQFEKLAAEPLVGEHWPPVWPVLALEAFAQSYFQDAA